MGSRKKEERNEKIIRGLLKLPPNRRCINCNSIGPQYVCPNFWTFVCTTCSGIHREFTHRVKSVSMSKFTSQEVEALQNGGNQRAREIYLRDWDLQRQHLADSSNVDRIREFIRSVYVDRKYAGGRNSEKPPRDLQNNRNLEEETRRASSYHSYSQSPPYDYQYEDRRYGKQAAALTRKPGSDRGRYEGKLSGFGYSAGHLSEQMYDDRFANDGSGSRVSDYSLSSGGDASRSGVHSPNFLKDIGSSSPFQPFEDKISEIRDQANGTVLESSINRDAVVMPFSQRTLSSGSFGSLDSYSMSLKSFNSGGITDAVSESDQYAGNLQDKPTSLSSLFGSSDRLDLSKAPVQSEEISVAPSSIDLFQLPVASSSTSIGSFQPSVSSFALSLNVHQPSQAFRPSLDFFADFNEHQSTAKQPVQESFPKDEGWATFDTPQPSASISGTENVIPVQESFPKDEGWATFDTPQPSASISGTENVIPANKVLSDGSSVGTVDLFYSSYSGMQWPSFANNSSQWSDNLHNFAVPSSAENTQSWNAFEDSIGHLPWEDTKKNSESVATEKISLAGDQYVGDRFSEDSSKDGVQRAASQGLHHDPGLPSHVSASSYTPEVFPQMGEFKSHATEQSSNNPFDVPYDTDLEQTNMFLDISSLQASLPDAELQSSFHIDVSQPWFAQNGVNMLPYIPSSAEGGLTYLTGQAQGTQILNVPTQGPATSIGGNPFA